MVEKNPLCLYSGVKKELQAGDTLPSGSGILTTKGDVAGFDSADARIPVGTNNQVLSADSTQALGVKWSTLSSGSGVFPSFYVEKSTGQSVNHATYTKLSWPTEIFDTNANFASDRFTPNVAGKYYLTASSQINSISNAKYLRTMIYKNGALLFEGARVSMGATGAVNTKAMGIVEANGTTDYFEVYVYQNNGAAATISATAASTYFQGYKIN